MFSNNSLKDTTSQILNDYEKREAMIQNLMDLVEEYNLDGVNVDFENMNESDKNVYSRFLIELAPRLREDWENTICRCNCSTRLRNLVIVF